VSELPEGWTTTQLGVASQVVRGITFPASAKDIQPDNSNVCCLRTSNIQKDIDWTDIYFIPRSYVKRDEQLVVPGDILMSMANSYDLVGKVAVAKAVDYPTAFGAFLSAIRPTGIIDGQYLFHLIRTTFVQTEIRLGSTQTTNIANISIASLSEIPIPLAPLAEQKVIADKLDALLAQVDTLKARLDAILAILKRFRQSVLSAAVTGKLTEEWRNIQSNGSNSSDNWKMVALGDRVENFDNQRKPISSALRAGRQGSYPYFGASGQIDTIDGYTHDGSYVLIGEDGANLLVRSKPIAFIASGRIWVNNHAHVLSCGSQVENQFFTYYINSIDLTPWVTGTAQPKLNQANMNVIPVPVPPLLEQTEIVRRVESLFAFADQIEARTREATASVKHLAQSILAKAFRGELTEEWRKAYPELVSGENSAEALLDRIRATRADAPQAKAKRGRKARDEKALIADYTEKLRTRIPSRERRMSKNRTDEDVMGKAYLAGCIASLGGKAKIESLYQESNLALPDFYKQLAWEVSQGLVKDLETFFEVG
jgi:type I restriction enzyme S subunit